MALRCGMSSYEMTRALSQRPTMLSLGSLDLLMECSQDHFTYDALDGKVGDESDGVVDREIYYHYMIFLTWISKHKKKYLHGSMAYHYGGLIHRSCYHLALNTW